MGRGSDQTAVSTKRRIEDIATTVWIAFPPVTGTGRREKSRPMSKFRSCCIVAIT